MNEFQLMMEQAMLSCRMEEERLVPNPVLIQKIDVTVSKTADFQHYQSSKSSLRDDVPSPSLSTEALFRNVPVRNEDWIVTPEAISDGEEEA